MITEAGADRVMAMDLHAGQIQGFFNILVDHIFANPILVDYFKSLNINPDDMVKEYEQLIEEIKIINANFNTDYHYEAFKSAVEDLNIFLKNIM